MFLAFAVALVEVFPTAFLKMFTNDQELIDIGINATRLFLAGMSVMGAQCACQQTFLALGEAKISMFLACLRKIILCFACTYTSEYRKYGSVGIAFGGAGK